MRKANYPDKYLEGIRCFNEGKYFECHELLESLWLKEKKHLLPRLALDLPQGAGKPCWLEVGGIQGIFYQALIQEAVALYHLGNMKEFFKTYLLRRRGDET